MKLLLDATLNYLNIALLNEKNIIVSIEQILLNKNLSIILLENIKDILYRNNIDKKQIKSIYVVAGPGSFTSLKLISVFTNLWKIENNIIIYEIDTLLWNSEKKHNLVWMNGKSNKIFYSFINWKISKNLIKICDHKHFEKKIMMNFKKNKIHEIKNNKDFEKNIVNNFDKFRMVKKIIPKYLKRPI